MACNLSKDKHFCKYCGWIDRDYDENSVLFHETTSKHVCNRILFQYKHYKSELSKNRDGINVFATCTSKQSNLNEGKTARANIIVHVKPKETCKFNFYVYNELRSEDVLVLGIQLAHPQPHFMMHKHPYNFNEEPRFLPKKSAIQEEICVTFKAEDIGQYEMPIMFTFHARSTKKDIIFIREMRVLVEESPTRHVFVPNPYTDKPLQPAENYLPAVVEQDVTEWTHVTRRPRRVFKRAGNTHQELFKIPKMLKILLPRGLGDDALDSLPRNIDDNDMAQMLLNTRSVFEEGMTVNNYMNYFHHLLWWEEVVAKISIKKYNMHGVTILKEENVYLLEVPGLAEKRPSLIRGDKVCLQPHQNLGVIFECVIKNIEDTYVHLQHMDHMFESYYSPEARFDVRFVISRIPIERCHGGVYHIFESNQQCRVFPEPVRRPVPVPAITKFFNPHISENRQQKSAVEHIVAGSSGLAPYIVFGPPGTGKTMTIVEAIIQLVVHNANNRILVCTDSNMAADHIALALYKYKDVLNIKNFIIRANSQMREWSVMPSELAPVSNGTCYETFIPLSNEFVSNYRIVVTTLLHSAKYIIKSRPHSDSRGSVDSDGPPRVMPYQPMSSRRDGKAAVLEVSHLFIDEAAQASEPAALIPISGLLHRTGHLVLAGDPQQLGPVCMARDAAARGLGTSLLERLYLTYPELYHENSNYITTLVNNFRSHPDILHIPNQLFYRGELQALAKQDDLSNLSILDMPGGDRAIVFHALQSMEQRMGRAPSYFNEKELEMLQRYVKALVHTHNVDQRDIGIIAPYIRQVYKMKAWLKEMGYENIETGTVEAFQGKEKRVILVSTVRANCQLLDYDATYSLGFLVDDKRFNVAVTRAKAKLVIIGNPSCLHRDVKWRIYMGQCKKLGTYLGEKNQQLERNTSLLQEIARERFDRCRLTDVLMENAEKRSKKKKAKKVHFNLPKLQ